MVDTTVFMVDPDSKFKLIWEVATDYWGQAPYPTLTTIGVTCLSGFDFDFDFDFEIKVIAKLPE